MKKQYEYRQYLEETITEYGATEQFDDGKPYRYGIKINDIWITIKDDPSKYLSYKKIQQFVYLNHQVVLRDVPNTIWVDWFKELVERCDK